MITFFRPKPSRFGTMPLTLSTMNAYNITANGTRNIVLNGLPYRKAIFSSGYYSSLTPAADADGTVLGSIVKYDSSASAYVVLTDVYDLEAVGAGAVKVPMPALATLTEQEKFIDLGDSLLFRVVNNSAAIDTQPTAPVWAAEVFLLE